MKKHKKVMIGFLIFAIVILMIFYFVARILGGFGEVVKGAHSYESYAVNSADDVFTLQTVKYEENGSVGVGFLIISSKDGSVVYKCQDRYRAYDLYYLNWIEGTYDIYVDSHDIGAFIYRYVNNGWNRENSVMNLYAEN